MRILSDELWNMGKDMMELGFYSKEKINSFMLNYSRLNYLEKKLMPFYMASLGSLLVGSINALYSLYSPHPWLRNVAIGTISLSMPGSLIGAVINYKKFRIERELEYIMETARNQRSIAENKIPNNIDKYNLETALRKSS